MDSTVESSDLSEYEKIRLQNIREREALFAKLNFSEAKQGLAPPVASKKKHGKICNTVRKQSVCLNPTRRSLRLSGRNSASDSG